MIPLIQNKKDLNQEDNISKLLKNDKKYIHNNDKLKPNILNKTTLTIEDLKNKIETTNDENDRIGFRNIYQLYSSYVKTKKKEKLTEREFITKLKLNFKFKKTKKGNFFMQIKIKS